MMTMMKLLLFVVLTLEVVESIKSGWIVVDNPQFRVMPCKGNEDIIVEYEPGRAPDEENQYPMFIKEEIPKYSRADIKLDSEGTITLGDNSTARITASSTDLSFHIRFFKDTSNLGLIIKGPPSGTVPYVTSIVINRVEYCENPKIGFLDEYIEGTKGSAHVALSTQDSTNTCGRRKVLHTELIVNGQPSKPGDWPWHTAIYRLEKATIRYICGGTLISKYFVLTAAHCVTSRGAPVVPEILSAVFGKYNLIGGDITTKEKEIHSIIVHEEYTYTRLDNDIALMKLKTEVEFDDYVQPACIWERNAYKKLPQGTIYGIVAGWGFDHTDTLSSELHQVKLPKISEATCIKSNPSFFGRLLTEKKFCAGYRNGTSACNGDSGGGYMIFVPDVSGDRSANATGSWYVRGIVSLGLSRSDAAICDNTLYSLFTDVAKYKRWIQKKIE